MQKEYGQLLQQLLEDIDHTLAEKRDKKRYALKDKRGIRMQTMFGEVEVKRTITSIEKNRGMSVCWMLFFSLRGHMESVRC
nr:UPF0236 family protein [Anoxybacillus sp. MB8]